MNPALYRIETYYIRTHETERKYCFGPELLDIIRANTIEDCGIEPARVQVLLYRGKSWRVVSTDYVNVLEVTDSDAVVPDDPEVDPW